MRLDAQQFDRVAKTGQSELFAVEEIDLGVQSFAAERQDNLRAAEAALVHLLRQRGEVDYEDARAAMMECPLVWERDVQATVQARAVVSGMKPRERTPKPGHRLRLK